MVALSCVVPLPGEVGVAEDPAAAAISDIEADSSAEPIGLASSPSSSTNHSDNDSMAGEVDLGSRCSSLQTTLGKKLEEFTLSRQHEATRKFESVVSAALCMMATGTFAKMLSVVVGIFLGQVWGDITSLLGSLLSVCGVVAGSTCPLHKYDIDEVMLKRYKVRVSFGLVLACYSLSTITRAGSFIYPVGAVFGLASTIGWRQRSLWRWSTTLMLFFGWDCMNVSAVSFRSFLSDDPVGASFVDASSYGLIVIGSTSLVWLLVLVVPVITLRTQYHRSAGAKGLAPTAAFWYAGYVYAVYLANYHFWVSLFKFASQKHPSLAVIDTCYSLAYAGPVALVCIMGRDWLFNFVARRLDSSDSRREQAGAFVAALLDESKLVVGQTWWLHLEGGAENTKYAQGDHRRNWSKGVVVEVSGMEFGVQLKGVGRSVAQPTTQEDKVMYLPLAARGMSSNELLKEARKRLRCINWESITKELMMTMSSSSLTTGQLDALSRPLRHGERIDYFMSHSWYDDADGKWNALLRSVDQFKALHGRYPTFWLDKVCIDQDSIADGLRALPVNVMSCNKMMVVLGETYTSRLWCIWELFTLLAFTDLQAALARVQVVPIAGNTCKQLAGFQFRNAHCYDPNEEAKLRHVIVSLGRDTFQERVCNLGRALGEHANKPTKLLSPRSW